MASSKITKNRYNNNATQKISYTGMPTRIKIIELFKKLLSMAYKRKKKIYYWLGFKELVAYKELEKGKA